MTLTSMPNPTAVQDVYAFPLSFAQQHLWLLDRLNPQNADYNRFSTVRISIPLNIETLEQTLQALIQRHEALRTFLVVREANQCK